MRFRVTGLDPASFTSLFTDDAALAARDGRRVVADETPGYPCRVSLADARIGDELVLVTYEHHATTSPYRASGPIFVRRDAVRYDAEAVPPMLRSRTLSIRAYDARGDMLDAMLCPGTELEPAIARLFEHPAVRYLHVHFATRGCFACRVDRVA
jgi:hypothetical protein